MRSIFIALTAACLAAGAHAAEVYKWTDAGGVVHYADSEPPAGAQAQHMRVGAAAKATAAAEDAAAPATESADKKSDAAPRIVTQTDLTERCQHARADLELLQSGVPVGLPAAGGAAPRPLDDAGRSAQIAVAQSAIAASCK